MKKIISLLLIAIMTLVMAVSFSSCGEEETPPDDNKGGIPQVEDPNGVLPGGDEGWKGPNVVLPEL